MAKGGVVSVKVVGSGNFVNLRFVECLVDATSSGGVLESDGDDVRLLASDFGMTDIKLILTSTPGTSVEADNVFVPMVTYEAVYSSTTKVADAFVNFYQSGVISNVLTSQVKLNNWKMTVFGNPI